MEVSPDEPTTVVADPRHVSWTHLMYALHAVAIVTGVLSTVAILTAFLFGWPSIIAVILNYVKRSSVRGTWVATHFDWQLRTFWWALAWTVMATLAFGPFALILIGIPPLLASYFAIGVWAAYRVVRGWLALRDGRPMPARKAI
jgi:uncharacterized membrane protein